MDRRVFLNEIEMALGTEYKSNKYMFDSKIVGSCHNYERINVCVRYVNEKIINTVCNQDISLSKVPYYLGSKYSVCNNVHAFDMQAVCHGALSVNPTQFPGAVLNSPTCHISINNSIHVAVNTILSGNISSLNALGMGFEAIYYGQHDYVVVGGFDEIGEIQSILSSGDKELCESVTLCLLGSKTNSLGEILGYELLGIVDNTINTCEILVSMCLQKIEDSRVVFDILLNCPDCINSEEIIYELQERFPYINTIYTPEKDYMGCNDIVQLCMYCKRQSNRKKRYTIVLGVETHQVASILLCI